MKSPILPTSAALIIFASLCCSFEARAQVSIIFQNQGTGPAGPFLWPIYLPETNDLYLEKHGNTPAGRPPGIQTYSGSLVSGSAYTAQLWVGPAGSSEAALVAVAATTFRTGGSAGLLVPVTTTFPLSPGSPFTWQARVWNNRNGAITSWAQAQTDPSIERGKSPVFVTTANATTTYNGQSFNVHLDGRPNVLFINEWLADNATGLQDEDGDHSDWIEFYNSGASSIDLSGFYVTDTLSDPTKWRVPSGNTIPARGFFLLFASSKDRARHTNFRFASSGESIGLYGPDGVTAVDTITFGPQATDISQGRWPDANTNIYSLIPTPLRIARPNRSLRRSHGNLAAVAGL